MANRSGQSAHSLYHSGVLSPRVQSANCLSMRYDVTRSTGSWIVFCPIGNKHP